MWELRKKVGNLKNYEILKKSRKSDKKSRNSEKVEN